MIERHHGMHELEASTLGDARKPADHSGIPALRAATTQTIYFEDVRVPPGNILGEEGKGFDFANNWLHNGRVMFIASGGENAP
jgi:alkylation response protein AidB-like acyl-CoA dehydrogenase